MPTTGKSLAPRDGPRAVDGARSIAAGPIWTEADGFPAFVVWSQMVASDGRHGAMLSQPLHNSHASRQPWRNS